MGLVVTQTSIQSTNGQVIEVTDNTPTYDVASNPTGYGKDRESGAISANAANDTFTQNSHGLANDEIIYFTDLGSLTGFNLDQAYFVIFLSNNDFSLAATAGGAAIDFGGTAGTVDYNVGYRKADEVDRTYFEVTAIADGTTIDVDPLLLPPFIPNGTTTDTTTLTAANVSGGSAGTVITDGVYEVSYIPTWSPNNDITDSGSNTYTMSGIDMSVLYEGYDFLLIIDGSTIYRYGIVSIEFTGGNTVITCDQSIHAGTFSNGDYFMGKSADAYVACTYNLHQCYLEQSAKMTKADYQSACNNVSSKQFQIVVQLNTVEQGAINSVTAGDTANAQQIIEYGTKVCNRLDATNCGC